MRESLTWINNSTNKDLIGVEVGVEEGRNAMDILENMNIQKLYLIDLWTIYSEDCEREQSTVDRSGGEIVECVICKQEMKVLSYEKPPYYHEKHASLKTINRSMYKEDVYEIFRDNRIVTIIDSSSALAAKTIEDNSVDFVYIDANHSYKNVIEDINSWLPKVKKGGYLCGHDYGIRSVKRAVLEKFNENTLVIKYEDWLVIK